ncbi:MAG: hypothetical protein ACRCUM_02720 [Mycoplasmoidaceae bacterium]
MNKDLQLEIEKCNNERDLCLMLLDIKYKEYWEYIRMKIEYIKMYGPDYLMIFINDAEDSIRPDNEEEEENND